MKPLTEDSIFFLQDFKVLLLVFFGNVWIKNKDKVHFRSHNFSKVGAELGTGIIGRERDGLHGNPHRGNDTAAEINGRIHLHGFRGKGKGPYGIINLLVFDRYGQGMVAGRLCGFGEILLLLTLVPVPVLPKDLLICDAYIKIKMRAFQNEIKKTC